MKGRATSKQQQASSKQHPYHTGSTDMAKETTQLTFSEEIFLLLDYWAWLHGKTAAMYSSQIVSARVAANLAEIEALGKAAADIKGITIEELKQQWRDSRGKSGGGEQ